jgi:hypothetical protein
MRVRRIALTFLGVCTHLMRRILVDRARVHDAAERLSAVRIVEGPDRIK